jgi:outer membrane protein OmpA-like peptidoglycan-associated protein
MMRRVAALTATLLIACLYQPTEADACGLKPTAQTPSPRHVARHTSGSVLLLGPRDPALERNLAAEGHTVETAQNVESAKRKSYNVIISDASNAGEAREVFGADAVVVRSGNAANDSRQVSARANRRPVRASDRAIVAARQARQPVAAGPTLVSAPPTPVAARIVETPPAATPPAATPPAETPLSPPSATPPTPPAERVVTNTRPAVRETPTEKPATVRVQAFARAELHFGVGRADVSQAMKGQLDRTARWLAANADSRIAIEGHADPSGNADANMALSRARAEAVRDYLQSAGVDASRMDVEGFGDTKLKYGAADGRNRRVSIEKR